MTTRLFALLSLVLVVTFSHAAPMSDGRLHVLEANVAKQMKDFDCVELCEYKNGYFAWVHHLYVSQSVSYPGPTATARTRTRTLASVNAVPRAPVP